MKIELSMIQAAARTAMAACLFSACMISTPSAMAETKILLDGDWQFRVDPKVQGEANGWWKATPDGTESVQVPNTWNVGKYEDYEGIAWYFKKFEVQREVAGKHIEIHFEATFYRARIWLNGVELG